MPYMNDVMNTHSSVIFFWLCPDVIPNANVIVDVRHTHATHLARRLIHGDDFAIVTIEPLP